MNIKMKSILLILLFLTTGCSSNIYKDEPVHVFPDFDTKKQRTMQELIWSFETKKEEINTIFRKSLLKNPNLGNKLSVRLGINNSGMTRNCKVSQSTLGNIKLENEVLSKICSINFGVKRGWVGDLNEFEYLIRFSPE